MFKVIYSRLPLSFQNRIYFTVYPVFHKSKHVNIFHCTTQKAGSQWIRRILSDRRTYTYSGLLPFDYEASLPGGVDPQNLVERSIVQPFPEKKIITPLYINYEGYKSLPKPKQVRAIFVVRDPRDLVVSQYYSLRYSHVSIGDVPRLRHQLKPLSESEGYLYVLEYLHSYGTFVCQRSWIEEGIANPEVLLIRFEDLIGEHNLSAWQKVFEHLDIQMPERILAQLLQDNDFKALSGRKQGTEDRHSHYRKGIPGDWGNHFDERLTKRFKELTGDLVVKLGYESDSSW